MDTSRVHGKKYTGQHRNYDTWPWKLLFALQAVWEFITSLFRRSPKMIQKAGDNATQIQVGGDVLHQRHAHFSEDITQEPNIFGQYWKA